MVPVIKIESSAGVQIYVTSVSDLKILIGLLIRTENTTIKWIISPSALYILYETAHLLYGEFSNKCKQVTLSSLAGILLWEKRVSNSCGNYNWDFNSTALLF